MSGRFPSSTTVRRLFLTVAQEQHAKNPERVAAGLKASIKNPNVSDEAKAHAAERLNELSRETHPTTHTAESNHVLGLLIFLSLSDNTLTIPRRRV